MVAITAKPAAVSAESEEIFVFQKTAPQMPTDRSATTGFQPSSTPKAVATPLPPFKSKKMG